MKNKKQPTPDNSLPNLIVPRKEAESKIQAQIQKGTEICNLPVSNKVTFDSFLESYNSWQDYTKVLLKTLFNSQDIANEFAYAAHFVVMDRDWTIAQQHEYYTDLHLKENLKALKSISERLELYTEYLQENKLIPSQIESSSNVFVVHGHDTSIKESVARFLEKIELNPIILHEQPNQGRTIIEKFVDYSNVGFAIILLTPDDLCTSQQDSKEVHKRARQNVILELGFFLGKLGRKSVCALYKGDVETPSDYSGVLYIPFDDAGAWQMNLAKEIKAAGIPAAFNKIIE